MPAIGSISLMAEAYADSPYGARVSWQAVRWTRHGHLIVATVLIRVPAPRKDNNGNMPLITCPDCQHEMSTEAAACPGCGRPKKQPGAGVCPYCGSHNVGKARGLQGAGEVLLGLLLLALGIIPGVIYYIVTEAKPYCSGCGRRVKR